MVWARVGGARDEFLPARLPGSDVQSIGNATGHVQLLCAPVRVTSACVFVCVCEGEREDASRQPPF